MNSWILLAVGDDDRVHGGNDGYPDQPERTYVWDSTVPRHAEVEVGDRIAIRSAGHLLGVSIIETIRVTESAKLRRRCPHCNSTDIRERKVKRPRWYCAVCRAEFDSSTREQIEVVEYRSVHGDGWIDLRDLAITARQLVSAQTRPDTQHSLRPARWDWVVHLVSTNSSRHELADGVAGIGGG